MSGLRENRIIRAIFHPVPLIIGLNITWTCTLLFWIFFFLGRYQQVIELAEDKGLSTQDLVSWAPLVLGILLLAAIFGGYIILTFLLAKHAIVNKQMKNFLSVVSHELRTPLTAVQLYLETMRDRDLEREQRKVFVNNMLVDVQRLSQQVSSIFDATRLEHGRMPLRKEKLELAGFVEKFVEQKLQTQPSTTDGHQLIVEAKECEVFADPNALDAVLNNLVRNAERYSPSGTEIGLRVTPTGKWAVLQVTDQGIGLEKKEQTRIFKLFYRAAAGSKASSKGSGLGLYIVKGLVQLHGGRVTAQSEGSGKGTTFSVRLPRIDSARGVR